MNFVADLQHAQEYPSTLFNHHERNRQDYASSSPCPSTYSQPHSPLSPSPYSQPTNFSHMSPIRQLLPEVGQTRCYWALLSTRLRFLILDPVLAYHLRDQASDILNTSLLEFVHPEERDSAKKDLDRVLSERTLHGSVTRVRFCRLSCVRRLLGYTPCEEAPPYPPTFPAERIAIDNNYMAIDIVLNWAAEGVVLCFLHAVVDIAPREDNDESVKTGWSNWCSTYGFGEHQAQGMFDSLNDAFLSQVRSHQGKTRDPSLRVLQILRNDQDRSLMLSWPPDSISTRSYTTVPHAVDLGRLAQHVEIGASGSSGDARTSCTRRYKSHQRMQIIPGDDCYVEVESIFVPHGSIIFACHKIDYVHHSQQSYCGDSMNQCDGAQGMVVDYSPSKERLHRVTGLGGAPYNLSYGKAASDHTLTQSTYVSQWVEGQSSPYAYEHQYRRRWEYANIHEHTPSPNSSVDDSSVQNGSMMRITSSATYESQWTKHSESAGDADDAHRQPSSHSVADQGSRTLAREVRRGNSSQGAGSDVPERAAGVGKSGTSREVYSGGRSSGNPPVGVLRCASCRATHSPEWRKGPSGKKDLCNACGLRFARSRAKKEGTAARKRKEREKSPSKRSSPPLLPTTPNVRSASVRDETLLSDTPGPPHARHQDGSYHSSATALRHSDDTIANGHQDPSREVSALASLRSFFSSPDEKGVRL